MVFRKVEATSLKIYIVKCDGLGDHLGWSGSYLDFGLSGNNNNESEGEIAGFESVD